MAETNTSGVAYIEESTWATTPASPELTEIRLTSDDLQHAKATVESAELRADRMTADLVQVSASAAGGFGYELSYASHDAFFESALYSDFTTLNESPASIAIAGDVMTGGSGDFDNFLLGGWVKIAGATTSSNNGFKRVIAKTDTTLTFASGSLSGSDSGETLTFTGSDLRNGTTEKSFTMERKIPHGGSDYFQVFTGMVAAQMSLSIVAEQISTGTFGFIGSVGAAGSSTIDNAGGYTDANANSIMNGTAGVGGVYIDDYSDTAPGATLATEDIKGLTLDINNNVRALTKLGNLGAFDLGAGEMNLSGTIEAYFSGNTSFADFIAHTYKSFAMSIADGAGNTYIITLPRINYTDANIPLSGKNADVMQPFAFRAIRDTVSGAQLIINRFAA